MQIGKCRPSFTPAILSIDPRIAEVAGLWSSGLAGSLYGREFNGLAPVVAKDAHDFDEGVEGDGFADEGVGADVVDLGDVDVGLGGGEDDDGYFAEFGVALDFAQGFAAIFFGHVKVKEDKARARGIGVPASIGTRSWCRGVFAAAVEVVEELFAVFDEVEFAGEFAFGEGVFGEEAVVGVVVGHEDYDGFGDSGHAGGCCLWGWGAGKWMSCEHGVREGVRGSRAVQGWGSPVTEVFCPATPVVSPEG